MYFDNNINKERKMFYSIEYSTESWTLLKKQLIWIKGKNMQCVDILALIKHRYRIFTLGETNCFYMRYVLN